MNALEIKENRKKLGLTQKELAELVGVSTQTINGYENGKEIPTTKHQILDKILNTDYSNINILRSKKTQADHTNPKTNITGYDKKISDLYERIYEHNEIIKLLNPKSDEAKHQIEIIRLLKIQIELIEEAKKNSKENL